MKADGADLTTQAKYYKAMIKDNKSLRTDIDNARIQTTELQKTFGKVLKQKDNELTEIKKDFKDLMLVVKELTEEVSKDGLHS